MTRKTKLKWDDPEESKRFLEIAEKAGIADDPKALDKAITAIAPRPKDSK